MQRLKDLKEVTKAVLSVYNAGVATLMYAYGAPALDLVSGGYLACGSCKSYSVLLACSTQAYNQVIEWKYDQVMVRTKDRPIPQNRFTPMQGRAISAATGLAGLACLAHFPVVAPVTGAAIWLSYILVYVPSKRITRYNTHIGAVIGSLPSYLGWSAATGTLLGVEPFLMAAFMTAWQFPHFYGILWRYKDDFNRAGFQMITNIDPNGVKMTTGCTIGAMSMLLTSTGMVATGLVNWWMYSGAMIYVAPKMYTAISQFGFVSPTQVPTKENAWKVTLASYSVIGTLFGLLAATMLYGKLNQVMRETFTRSEKKIYEDAVPCKL